MSGQVWALVASDGSYVIRYTESADAHPADHGHRAECKSRNVWALPREPDRVAGEGVNFTSGAFDFDKARVAARLIAAIKAEAGRRIEAAVPLWRQINDINEPGRAGTAQRRALVNAHRTWSDALEAAVLSAASADDIRAIRAQLTENV